MLLVLNMRFVVETCYTIRSESGVITLNYVSVVKARWKNKKLKRHKAILNQNTKRRGNVGYDVYYTPNLKLHKK